MRNEVLSLNNADYSEEQKRQAAYALNLCTVSISQIIDYRDSYIMDQEYDAILNNLNLFEMPKDEALLKTLTEILNTITYFRIADLKKAQLEKKYEQRMKNAIWSAVPSLSVVVSGNPVAIAMALITQIGSGYMNYRREKSNALSDKEDAEVELEITAIEQLNALRRELFTTAWRLADAYKFDDEWRLTEKQIKQYNEILMDNNLIRKYERLESIQNHFKAYPPFWYFFGNTANLISKDHTLGLSDSAKRYYEEQAEKHYATFEDMSMHNLLREDQLAASCALEHAELLISAGNYDSDKICRLIADAVRMSGNALDIVEVCAITYLKLDRPDEASKLLRILVNEDYNIVVNAQLLSGIYVRKRMYTEYEILKTRVPVQFLFPIADKSDDIERLEKSFEESQRNLMLQKVKIVLKNIGEQYSSELSSCISDFNSEDRFISNSAITSPKSKKTRIAELAAIFSDENARKNYLEQLRCVNLPLQYITVLDKMYRLLFSSPLFNDSVLQAEVVELTKKAMSEHKMEINNQQNKIENGSFALSDYSAIINNGVIPMIKNSFNLLATQLQLRIRQAPMDELYSIEGYLYSLCSQCNIELPEITVNDNDYHDPEEDLPAELFDISEFGTGAIIAKNNYDYLTSMTNYIKEQLKKITVHNATQVFYRGDSSFDRYFSDQIFREYPQLKSHSIAVIRDLSKESFDLIFTDVGIVNTYKGKVRKKTPYEDVKVEKGALILFDRKYSNSDIENGLINEICETLHGRFINGLSSKIEYIGKELTRKDLHDWFTSQKGALQNGVQKVVSYPDVNLLNNMGYYIREEFDNTSYLLQFYYEKKSGSIINLRLIHYSRIEPALKELLQKNNGLFVVD